jgi:hypothetical protein
VNFTSINTESDNVDVEPTTSSIPSNTSMNNFEDYPNNYDQSCGGMYDDHYCFPVHSPDDFTGPPYLEWTPNGIPHDSYFPYGQQHHYHVQQQWLNGPSPVQHDISATTRIDATENYHYLETPVSMFPSFGWADATPSTENHKVHYGSTVSFDNTTSQTIMETDEANEQYNHCYLDSVVTHRQIHPQHLYMSNDNDYLIESSPDDLSLYSCSHTS